MSLEERFTELVNEIKRHPLVVDVSVVSEVRIGDEGYIRLCDCWGDVSCVGSGCPGKCPDQRGQGEELRLFDFYS